MFHAPQKCTSDPDQTIKSSFMRALTWCPPPVVLCHHVYTIDEVFPEFLEVAGLRQTARYPCYNYLIHAELLWTEREMPTIRVVYILILFKVLRFSFIVIIQYRIAQWNAVVALSMLHSQNMSNQIFSGNSISYSNQMESSQFNKACFSIIKINTLLEQ